MFDNRGVFSRSNGVIGRENLLLQYHGVDVVVVVVVVVGVGVVVVTVVVGVGSTSTGEHINI